VPEYRFVRRATLAVGKNCKMSVTFTPPSGSGCGGTLTLTDNALNSPQTCGCLV